jgi:hypothetical protein
MFVTQQTVGYNGFSWDTMGETRKLAELGGFWVHDGRIAAAALVPQNLWISL